MVNKPWIIHGKHSHELFMVNEPWSIHGKQAIVVGANEVLLYVVSVLYKIYLYLYTHMIK